jgi:ABC-2 type transport system ATP-binding protein
MNAVEIERVTKTFGSHTAVDDLSLGVPGGSVYGFIGPNGSGKTTTLRMIMNIFYPDSGSIRVFGHDRREAYTDRVGYLPEERGLYKKMKVRALLRFYGNLKGGRHVKQDVDLWLERFELTDWANKKVETLSKGMAQKVQFIAAVVARPEMLILDEPFSGLDPVNTDVIRDAALELRNGGTTIIFSTHDMATAEDLCDFIFMIFRGKKVLDGTLESIQGEFGDDTIRLRIDGDGAALAQIPGVHRVHHRGHLHELRITADSDPQEILRAVMSRARVKHFEVARPSLYDIFVRIAGPEAEENHHVQND